MLYAYIGKRIREQRILRQMTQEELAEAADVSLSFIGHIERGTRKLSVETLYKIVVALDCSANELLGVFRPEERMRAKDLLAFAEQLLEQKEMVPARKREE